jgi:hypothetical protein
MTYQGYGHRGMWSISIAILERSPDIEVPETVDDDPDPRDWAVTRLNTKIGLTGFPNPRPFAY